MRNADFEKYGMGFLFNDLEKDIVSVLWNKGESRSRSLYLLLGDKHKVTHSTIAVTLNRLYSRGILLRRPEKARGGTRFVYYSRLSKEEFGNRMADKFLDFLRKNFGESCVANLKKRIE